MLSDTGIPLLGIGTFPLTDTEVQRAVITAIEVGFRHIDTAQMYGNEKQVGKAIRTAGVPRPELYVVTKVDPGNLAASRFKSSVEKSIADLGSPADLLLIHWPPADDEIEAAIDRLAEAHAAGLAKNIGISNFPTRLMRQAAQRSPVKLINNQVEFHALIDQGAVLAQARALGMTLSAYCPLGRGMVMKDAVIQEIAARHGRPPSEVALRWIIQQGVAAIPMTTKRDNAISNFSTLSFTLPDEDMAAISARSIQNKRLISPSWMRGRWDNETA